jgi:hypothetical protein
MLTRALLLDTIHKIESRRLWEMVMLDGILTQIGPTAGAVTMLAGAVWMIFTGRLVTRREADGIKSERDYWREAFKEEQRQSTKLLEVAEVASATMKALPKPSREHR